MKVSIEEYLLPDCFASALVNGDYSGLSDEDETALNVWLERYSAAYNGFACVGTKGSESEFSAYHDMHNEVGAANCCTFLFSVNFIKTASN